MYLHCFSQLYINEVFIFIIFNCLSTTEEVALEKSAKNAIESVKKNAEQGNFIIDHDKFGRFYYKLRNAQKSVICIGEAYETLDSCTSAIESVRRFALTAIFVED